MRHQLKTIGQNVVWVCTQAQMLLFEDLRTEWAKRALNVNSLRNLSNQLINEEKVSYNLT